jgi:hypothetical protein
MLKVSATLSSTLSAVERAIFAWHDFQPGWALHQSHHEPRIGPIEVCVDVVFFVISNREQLPVGLVNMLDGMSHPNGSLGQQMKGQCIAFQCCVAASSGRVM